MAQVTYDLKNIELRIENLKKIGKALFGAGQTVLYETKKNWLSGRGADAQALKPYSAAYKRIKGSAGRSTTPDMVWSGAMMRGLRVTSGKTSTTAVSMARTAEVGVTTDQRDKLQWNVARRGNLMAASDNQNLVQKITKYVLERIRGKM